MAMLDQSIATAVNFAVPRNIFENTFLVFANKKAKITRITNILPKTNKCPNQ
jgi:hypothetical protein